MTFEKLNEKNVDDYIAFLKTAMQEEPDMMTAEKVDEQGIKSRISDPFFTKPPLFLQGKRAKW